MKLLLHALDERLPCYICARELLTLGESRPRCADRRACTQRLITWLLAQRDVGLIEKSLV